MEHYYQTTVRNLLPVSAVFNVTGYSLGAHLATVFTELHGLETNTGISFGHTYTFNGPGRGEFSGGQRPEAVEADRIRTMITRLTEVLTDPIAGIEPGTPEELWPPSLHAAVLAWQQDPTWDPWASGSPLNIYADSRYLWAKQVVQEEFSPVSRALSDIPRTDGAFSLITQIVGHATHDLAIGTTVGLSGSSEAKPLENALDVLRRLVLPEPVSVTPADPSTGGFGNLANRNKFYEGIAAVKTALAGGTVTIEPLVELNAQGSAVVRLTPAEIKTAALENTDRGLAFRYALKALNPFAIIGADYQGLGHTSNGQLALFDSATGFGEMTDQYLMDRAAFLEAKIELGVLNQEKSTDTIHFHNVASTYEI